MGLFKNGVGRPSNETIRKRRIIAAVMIFAVVLVIGACVFYTVNYYKNREAEIIEGSDKDVVYKKISHILHPKMQCDNCSIYWQTPTVSETFAKSISLDLSDDSVFTIAMGTAKTMNLKIQTSYDSITTSGVKKKVGKAYYKVEVIARDANYSAIDSNKKTIKSTPITQTLKVDSRISEIAIIFYNAQTDKILEKQFYRVYAWRSDANIDKKFPDGRLKSCVLAAYNTQFKKKKTDLTNAELAKITHLHCEGFDISSTKGIEYLTGLTSLYLEEAGISSIDLSKNTKLKTLLILDGNPIKKSNIKVGNNKNLEIS